MSETVLAALVGVGGAVLVAIVSVITQLCITKAVIKAERERISDQIRGEEISRLREKRIDSIRIAVSELLATSDPQSNRGVDYGRTCNLISQVQLLLDLRVQSEAALNGALKRIGLCLQEYVTVQHLPIDSKTAETRELLQVHSAVLETAKTVIA